jgi:hypothetical protein
MDEGPGLEGVPRTSRRRELAASFRMDNGSLSQEDRGEGRRERPRGRSAHGGVKPKCS